jgi:hypothetical protein
MRPGAITYFVLPSTTTWTLIQRSRCQGESRRTVINSRHPWPRRHYCWSAPPLDTPEVIRAGCSNYRSLGCPRIQLAAGFAPCVAAAESVLGLVRGAATMRIDSLTEWLEIPAGVVAQSWVQAKRHRRKTLYGTATGPAALTS